MTKAFYKKILSILTIVSAVLLLNSCQKEFLITAMPDDGSHGTVNGGGVYKEGTVIEIWAVPATGYRFERWDDGYTDNPRTITVTGKATYIAIFSGGVFTDAFSVSATRTVYFSPGNLQWSATNGGSSPTYHPVAGGYGSAPGTWRFAPNQWDIIGIENRYIDSAYTGWIDLFGWGTSGYDNKWPYMTATHPTGGYGYGNNDIAGTYYDWGVYNSIYNPQTNTIDGPGWRTMTSDEWEYLLNTRLTASGIRYAKAVVHGVNGLIIVPDNWKSDVYSFNKTNNYGVDYTSNTVSIADWEQIASDGCIFLPAGGYRNQTTVSEAGSEGGYWSASYEYDEKTGEADEARILHFDAGNLYPAYIGWRSLGYSVRLVKDAQ